MKIDPSFRNSYIAEIVNYFWRFIGILHLKDPKFISRVQKRQPFFLDSANTSLNSLFVMSSWGNFKIARSLFSCPSIPLGIFGSKSRRAGILNEVVIYIIDVALQLFKEGCRKNELPFSTIRKRNKQDNNKTQIWKKMIFHYCT